MNSLKDFFRKIQNYLSNVAQQLLILILILGVIFFIIFELLFLQPINLNNGLTVLIILVLIWLFLMTLPFNNKAKEPKDYYGKNTAKFSNTKMLITITALLFVAVYFLMNFVTSKLFISKQYASLIGEVSEVEFNEIYSDDNIIETSYIDKSAALIAAEKKIGELADLSSIYTVDVENFSKIKYQGRLVRIAPLKHINHNYRLRENNKGIPYYVMVDVSDNKTSARAELVKIEDNPVKYSPNAMFFKSLDRLAFMHNPTYTYGSPTFELDESGTPHFTIPILKHKFLGVKGAYLDKILIVNANTGKSEEYELDKIPLWVDRVYPTDLILNQAVNHYKFKNGFWGTRDMLWSNRVGLKDIDTEIDSYNYITINDDIHIFTGVRPLGGEGSATTSILYMNIRTGDVQELIKSGVSLQAAKRAAIESVIEKGYTPTTPNLISVEGHPTYAMTLKSDSGTSYGFSMVNYEDLNLNAFGNSLYEVRKNYLTVMGGNGSYSDDFDLAGEYIILNIKNVTIDGNTKYYIQFENQDNIYVVDITTNSYLPFMVSGDKVSVASRGSLINFIEVID